MTILVLLNAAAGSIEAGERQAAEVAASFARHGLAPEVRLVRGSELARAAKAFVHAAGPAGVLVVGGGDGSINAAADAIAGSALALGVLPLGTFNHFAKDLGLPLDLDGAVATIAHGHVRAVDVGEVNGRAFVNNSSVGLYPLMVAHRNAEQHRHGLGKIRATFRALWRLLRGSVWSALTITVDGESRVVRTPCIFVGNNPYDISNFGSRSTLNSGRLGVTIVLRRTWGGLASLPFEALFGDRMHMRDVEALLCTQLQVNSRRRRLRVSRDGEVDKLVPPLTYRIRPEALRVLAPEMSDNISDNLLAMPG